MITTMRSNLGEPTLEARDLLLSETVDAVDAKELLAAFVDATLNHHKLLNLRSQVRDQTSDSKATSRIGQLQALQAQLGSILAPALEEGMRVRIRTTVEVEPVQRD